MKSSVVFVLLLIGLNTISATENRYRFHEPTHHELSVEKGVPVHRSAASNVVSKTKVPREGRASPIVWNDSMFSTSATDGAWVYVCFGDDGFAVSNFTGDSVGRKRVDASVSAPPICSEGRIYVRSDERPRSVIEAGPEFKVLAENPHGEKCRASTTVLQRQLFNQTECLGKVQR